MSVDQDKATGWAAPLHTGVLVLATGEVVKGFGVGATGEAVGEVCFNTAMTGYEEILTDLPMPGRSSPSPFRISAMWAPMTRT